MTKVFIICSTAFSCHFSKDCAWRLQPSPRGSKESIKSTRHPPINQTSSLCSIFQPSSWFLVFYFMFFFLFSLRVLLLLFIIVTAIKFLPTNTAQGALRPTLVDQSDQPVDDPAHAIRSCCCHPTSISSCIVALFLSPPTAGAVCAYFTRFLIVKRFSLRVFCFICWFCDMATAKKCQQKASADNRIE